MNYLCWMEWKRNSMKETSMVHGTFSTGSKTTAGPFISWQAKSMRVTSKERQGNTQREWTA